MDTIVLTKENIASLLAASFKEACRDRFSLSMREADIDDARFYPEAASVRFFGAYTGHLSIHITKGGLKRFASALLGQYAIDVPVDDGEVLKEFINIFAAHLATALNGYGLALDIGSPNEKDALSTSAAVSALCFMMTILENVEIFIEVSIDARNVEYVRYQ